MTPLDDVVATRDAESDPAEPLLFVELQPPPPIPDVGDGEALELPLLLLFVLFRDARLLALALIRRFKSSLRSDLSGETCDRQETENRELNV